ncbi:hypothetical protein D3C81_2124730 [compost metagenome]
MIWREFPGAVGWTTLCLSTAFRDSKWAVEKASPFSTLRFATFRFVGWVERSDTHAAWDGGYRCRGNDHALG